MLKIGSLYIIKAKLHFFSFEDYDNLANELVILPEGSVLLVLEYFGPKFEQVLFFETGSNRKIYQNIKQLAFQYYEEIKIK